MSNEYEAQASVNAWNLLDRAKQVEFPQNNPEIIEIWGYTGQLSYVAGDEVKLHVHTTAKTFSIEVYRDGPEPLTVFQQDDVKGVMQQTPDNAYEVGCNWSEVSRFRIGEDWRSGTYIVLFKTVDKVGQPFEREAFFVLRNTSQSKNNIVFVLTTGTYMAYSDWGGANAYRGLKNGVMTDEMSPRLSMNRPWARGFARLPVGAPRYSEFQAPREPRSINRYPWLEFAFAYEYSRHYVDAGWAYYDRHFAHWLEREGYDIDYCTLHDLHADGSLLDNYKMMFIGGHDEYWSWQMRDAVDNFVEQGGKLARFGGNYLWQVRMEDNNRTQVCYKLPADDPLFETDQKYLTSSLWDIKQINRPGADSVGLTGISGVYSRMPGACPRASGGITIYRPEHWAFAGTDLYYGDVIGAAPASIVSFEVDGANYTFDDGLPYPTGKDGVSKELEILALAPTAGFYEEKRGDSPVNAAFEEVEVLLNNIEFATDPGSPHRGNAAIGVVTKGKGEIFTAGCSEWVSGLIKKDPIVERITRNVINRYTA